MAFNWIKTKNGDGNGMFRNAQGKLNAGGKIASVLSPVAAVTHAFEDKNLDPKLNPRKAMVEMLARETKMLNEDPNKLGLTDAQKQQQVDEATRQAQAQTGNQNAALARTALAGQDFQQGAFQDAAAEASKGIDATAASASANAEAQHLALIEQARQRIMSGLAAERMRRRENRQYWANYAMSGAQSIGEMFGLGAGGPPAPTSAPTTAA